MQELQKRSRDFTKEISLEFAEKLVSFASNKHDIRQSEGVLVDSYIIYDTQDIQINRLKTRKYIIITEKYVNPWKSALEMTLTDKYDLVEFYENMWDSEEENDEVENY